MPCCAQTTDRVTNDFDLILLLTMDKQKTWVFLAFGQMKCCGLLNKFFWPLWTQMHILYFKHLPSFNAEYIMCSTKPGIQAEFCLLSCIGFRFLKNNIVCSSTDCKLDYNFLKKMEKTGKLNLCHTWVCCSERNTIRSVKCWFILKIKSYRKLYVFRETDVGSFK